MARYPVASEVLMDGFKKWRHDAENGLYTPPGERAPHRFSPSEASQTYFANEVVGVDMPSWSKWAGGNVRPELDNLNKLAACLYIGRDIYPAFGIPLTVIDDPRFQAMAKDWYELDEDTRVAMYNLYRGNAPVETEDCPGELGDLRTALA